MSELRIERVEGGFEFFVKVVPGSSRTAVAGLMGERLKVKVAAPPEKGKANKGLVEFLAKKVGVKRGDVIIVAGETSEVKHVMIRTESVDDAIGKMLDL